MYAVKIMDVRRSGDEPRHCKALKNLKLQIGHPCGLRVPDVDCLGNALIELLALPDRGCDYGRANSEARALLVAWCLLGGCREEVSLQV